MAKDDPDVWFEPKRYGYGAGLPVAWQGWMFLIGYLVVVTAATVLLLVERWETYAADVVVTAAATGALLVVTARHTRGGLRWRWGRQAGR